jgi:CRISPR/Cas system CMR-associated protein Cmr5 small subunit
MKADFDLIKEEIQNKGYQDYMSQDTVRLVATDGRSKVVIDPKVYKSSKKEVFNAAKKWLDTYLPTLFIEDLVVTNKSTWYLTFEE